MTDNLTRLIKALSDSELAERTAAFMVSGDRELYLALISEQVRRGSEAVNALSDLELSGLIVAGSSDRDVYNSWVSEWNRRANA